MKFEAWEISEDIDLRSFIVRYFVMRIHDDGSEDIICLCENSAKANDIITAYAIAIAVIQKEIAS